MTRSHLRALSILSLALVLCLSAAVPASAQNPCTGITIQQKPANFEKITVSTNAVGLTAATAGTAVMAVAHVEVAAVRVRGDAAPDATTGHPAVPGQDIYVCGASAIASVKFIRRDSSDATLQVAYFKAR